MKITPFRFQPFSPKQLQVLRWWRPKSPFHDYDGIIADGAIRSGKTICMGLSFVMWSMESFSNQQFAFCGKSIGSLKRNVIVPLLRILPGRGYIVHERRSDNCIDIMRNGVQNTYYYFGGRDESSQDLIQGKCFAFHLGD